VTGLSDYIAELKRKGLEASEPHELADCWISVVADPDGNQVWLHESKPR